MKFSLNFKFSKDEIDAIQALAIKKELSIEQVVRQAVRMYQLVEFGEAKLVFNKRLEKLCQFAPK